MTVEIIGKEGMLGSSLLDEIIKRKDFELSIKNKTLLWSAGTIQKNLPEHKIQEELQEFTEVIKEYSANGFNNLIYLSSAGSLYESSTNIVSTESTKIKPENSYGFLKHAEEEILQKEFAEYFDRIIIIRLANIYGRSLADSNKLGLIDRAIYCNLNDLELTINVNKSSRKNYGFRGDYAKNIISILENQDMFDPLEIINLGPNISYSIEEIISVIERYSQKEMNVTYLNQNINETVLIKTENEKLLSIIKESDPWISLEQFLITFSY
jgi:nucleoside-diphosphate-sugar epimerase